MEKTVSNSKRILVTGANGMLASNIIEHLLAGGYSVTATVRSLSSYKGPQAQALELVECDFKDSSAMSRILPGCFSVIHCAAMTSQSEKDYSKFRKVNVEASENLLIESIEAGVSRFVFVSTANTIGYGGSEGAPMVYPFTASNYALSKAEAEKHIRTYCGKADVIIVNPTFMAGKYGTPGGANRLFNMVRKSPVVFCPKGGKSILDVNEAARGIVLAMEKGKNGENYLISGENMTYSEIFRSAAAAIGRKPVFVTIPDCILRIAGRFGDLLHAVGVSTELSSSNLCMLRIKNYYNTGKASDELGFVPAKIDFSKILEWEQS